MNNEQTTQLNHLLRIGLPGAEVSSSMLSRSWSFTIPTALPPALCESGTEWFRQLRDGRGLVVSFQPAPNEPCECRFTDGQGWVMVENWGLPGMVIVFQNDEAQITVPVRLNADACKRATGLAAIIGLQRALAVKFVPNPFSAVASAGMQQIPEARFETQPRALLLSSIIGDEPGVSYNNPHESTFALPGTSFPAWAEPAPQRQILQTAPAAIRLPANSNDLRSQSRIWSPEVNNMDINQVLSSVCPGFQIRQVGDLLVVGVPLNVPAQECAARTTRLIDQRRTSDQRLQFAFPAAQTGVSMQCIQGSTGWVISLPVPLDTAKRDFLTALVNTVVNGWPVQVQYFPVEAR